MHSFCSFPMFVLWSPLDLILAVVIPYLLSAFFSLSYSWLGRKVIVRSYDCFRDKRVQGIQNMESNASKITKLNALTMKENFITVSIIFLRILQYFIQRCLYYLPVDLYRQMISTPKFSRFICKSLFSIWFVVLTVRIHVPSLLIPSLDFVTLFCALRSLRENFFALFLILLLFLYHITRKSM